jgi:type IV pilus assembly protein PilO
MDLSLSKLPWWGQIGAFVIVSAGAVFGFWSFYVAEVQSEMAIREARLQSLRLDAQKGNATARRLPSFQAEVTALEERLETLRQVLPEEKDVADILRRIQGLAAKSNLTIRGFQPGTPVQQKLYQEIPYRIQAEGTYHNLASFFDQVARFPRIITISGVSITAKDRPSPTATIVAECIATTFVLQDGAAKGSGGAAIPKQPSLAQ